MHIACEDGAYTSVFPQTVSPLREEFLMPSSALSLIQGPRTEPCTKQMLNRLGACTNEQMGKRRASRHQLVNRNCLETGMSKDMNERMSTEVHAQVHTCTSALTAQVPTCQVSRQICTFSFIYHLPSNGCKRQVVDTATCAGVHSMTYPFTI